MWDVLGQPHPCFSIWNTQRSCTATLVFSASTPSSESHPSSCSALYSTSSLITCPTASSSAFPSLWLSLLLVLHRNTEGVWYTYVGDSSPFLGSILPVPGGAGGRELSAAGWPFPSPWETAVWACAHGGMNVSVRMWIHARAGLCVVSWTICSCLTPSTSVLATIAAHPTGMTAVCQGSSDTS